MDMFGLLIAALLAIPVLAVVAIVLAVKTRDRLKQLEFRLGRLEQWLALRAGEGLAPEPGPMPETLPAAAAEPVEALAGQAPSPPEPEAAAAPQTAPS